MFFDFSSVFNKIQPLLFGDELRATQVDSPLVPWIMDFLSCGAQFVRLRSCMSGTVVSNTGAPPGDCPLPLPVYSLQLLLQLGVVPLLALWTNCKEAVFYHQMLSESNFHKNELLLNASTADRTTERVWGITKTNKQKSYHGLLVFSIKYVHFMEIYWKHRTQYKD